ncbi:eukaryotic translation initiation factor 3 subunit B-like [Schistocerca gregaria]|uniref:eukaryotic translation initiation factor 3 subunit B-like n=1 Tax=Schistocerca gregaria TaxID=7010 RepID=UPI00211DB1D4|nr:eukaryotic translation initiation factor 3 subunit B-like [Schistocerca gregaria]
MTQSAVKTQFDPERICDNYVVVDNVPIIDTEKKEKLKNSLKKRFSKYGEVLNIEIPFKEEGGSLGFCFIEYANPDQAEVAALKMDKQKFDSKHTFRVNKWSDYRKIDQLPDVYQPLTIQDLCIKDDCYSWLLDPANSDQFFTLYDNIAEIFVYQNGQKPISIMRRHDFTELFLEWSPGGIYLATLHSAGVSLWGGAKFDRLGRFEHQGVKAVQFSPKENFLCTISPKNPPEEFVFWDLCTGSKICSFPRIASKTFVNFKWSHDDKYVARLKDGQIHVYDSSTFKLLENAPIKAMTPIASFEWSPASNQLIFYVPESGSNPARLTLIRVPDFREVAQKNIFGVTNCTMHWQSHGEYLAVKVDIAKSKKRITNSFEIFRIKEKSIPIESMKFDDMALSFCWEPNGQRFAIIHSRENYQRPSVSFYTMEFNQIKLICTLEKRQVNALFWSPMGEIVVLANLPSGTLEFYNVASNESICQDLHHPNASHCEWNPTGCYFVTYSSSWEEKGETGWMMWSPTGKELHSEIRSGSLYQFRWRPRPPSLLTKKDEKYIQENWDKICEEFKKEDEAKRRMLEEINIQRRQELKSAFERMAAALHKEWVEQTPIRRELRDGYRSDDESVWYEVETTKEIVEEKFEYI